MSCNDNDQTIVTNLKEHTLNTGWAFGEQTLNEHLPESWNPVDTQVPDPTLLWVEGVTEVYPYSELFPASPLMTDPERIYNLYTEDVATSAEGWLSTFDTFFADNSITPPATALFGYTITPDTTLGKCWPKTDEEIEFANIRVFANDQPVDDTWYTVTADGLWWTKDEYSDAPLNSVIGDDKTYTITLFTHIKNGELSDGLETGGILPTDPLNTGSDYLEIDTYDLGKDCDLTTQVIRGFQNQVMNLELPITDRNGVVVPLDPTTHIVTLVLRKSPTDTSVLAYVVPELEDTTVAKITIEVADAGIYQAQLLVSDATEDKLLHVTNYYMVIEPVGELSDVVTIDEMRMHLMDNCPDDNSLLLAYEYSDADIINAMKTAVDYYNGFGIRKTNHTVTTMPRASRYFYKLGITSLLLKSAGYKFARNQLPYNAGGVSIDDQSKAPMYIQMANDLDIEWKDYVSGTKQAMNIAGGFFTI